LNLSLKSVEKYDMVIGPVADDTTQEVIGAYLVGRIGPEEAIRQLKAQTLDDQYNLLTKDALAYLTYEGCEIYEAN